MMSFIRIRNICFSKQLNALRTVHSATKQQTEIEPLTKQDAKVTQSTDGITVASVENYSPISQVSVIVKAGSMCENPSNLGVSHCLRNAATLTTAKQSAFSMVRDLEMRGSKLSVTSTKEHIIYTLQCLRDEIDASLYHLADVSTNKKFRSWELKDMTYRLEVDLAQFENDLEAVLMEELHRAAFRGGLSNSLYSPKFMLGRHTSEMLEEFVTHNFSSSHTSVVGLGMSHDYLQESVNKLFNLSKSPAAEATSKFGSGEVRIEKDIPFVHSAIVAEAPGILNTKECLSLGVLQCILEAGPTHVQYGGFDSSKLGETAAKSVSNPFTVSCININYANTGLFGIYVRGMPGDMKHLLTSCASKMRDIVKSLSDQDVSVGKHKLKAKLRLERDASSDLLQAMTLDTAYFGQIRDIAEIEKSIDALKKSDVAAIAAKVTKSKPAMASLGRLHDTPHLDELL